MMYPERFRIGITQCGLIDGYFQTLGLAQPDLVSTKSYLVKKTTSLGGERRQGHEKVQLLWNSIPVQQANIIESWVLLAGDDELYLTIPRSDATTPSKEEFLDLRGRPLMPEWNPVKGGGGFTNVLLEINNVVWSDDIIVFSSNTVEVGHLPPYNVTVFFTVPTSATITLHTGSESSAPTVCSGDCNLTAISYVPRGCFTLSSDTLENASGYFSFFV